MNIAELFRRDIHRTIEEVVKVDVADEHVIANELDEYVATQHIVDELEKVLDAYQETINSPNESCTVWVSGFFGSGKSGFSKVLGYLLWNPTIDGRPAIDRFFERTDAPRLKALLNTIHERSPTLTVPLNLATGSNVVAREGESVVLPVFRALLERLGYSRNFLLAELEFVLEGDGRLQAFEDRFAEATGRQWAERRFTSLAKNEASQALHRLDPGTFPQPDSWAKTASEPDIDADWFTIRALDLLQRRGEGATRLAFVMDEAGQYVSRSVQRILDLQGLAESFQKQTGRIWLVATSQERLHDVVDSLESAQVELARAQARFPLRVDLLPSDIDEVTGKRVLDKTDHGQRAVRNIVADHRNKLAANTSLNSPTRASNAGEDEVVRLYPLLPYQIQLLIDAVAARRTQGGASPTVGGSNRTLIKHAQQLITHPQHGLGDCDVGVLVTMDRSYNLLEELIPTSWRSEVQQVADRYGTDSLEAKTMKVIALCAEVPALPMTAGNIAVLVHPAVHAESIRDDVTDALGRLVTDDRLRESDDGYKLQSPEQKDWEQTRRGIDLTQGQSVRLRRLLLKQALSGLSVAKERTFKVQVAVEGETVVAGDLPLHVDEADSARRESLRSASRESTNQNRITWAYELSSDTWDAFVELHRSRSMIERRDTPNKTPAEVELLGEEREREARTERTVLQRLGHDLATGQAVFRGRLDSADGGDIKATARALVAERIDDIYPQLGQFTASLRREDVIYVLRTADLGTVHGSLRDDGINLVHVSPSGYEFVTDSGPLDQLVTEIRSRASYGQEPTGDYLESHFGSPPYGASVEVVQALCAAGLRAGLIEVIHQGQVIRNPTDARLDQVFGALPRFRSAGFRPPADTDVPLEKRVDLAEKLEHLGHRPAGPSTDVLASTIRDAFLPSREATVRATSALNGLGIAVPEVLSRTSDLLDRLRSDVDGDVVITAHDTWADLVAGKSAVERLDELLQSRLDDLRVGQREARRPADDLSGELAAEHAELCDLLDAGALADDAPRITAISSRIAQARTDAAEEAGKQLLGTLDELRAKIREQWTDEDDAALAEALRPLDALVPDSDLDGLDAPTLRGRIDTAHARARQSEQQLAELGAAGRLAWVRVSDLIPGAITDETEIAAVLNRIREAIEAELARDNHVRLQ